MAETVEILKDRSETEVAYEPHTLQGLVDMITGVIETQSYLFNRLTMRYTEPESTVDARAWDELHLDRMVAAQTCIRVIRLYQDRLLKMSIDMNLDSELIIIKDQKLLMNYG